MVKLAWQILREFARVAAPYWPLLAGLILVYTAAFLLRRKKTVLPAESNAAALDLFFRHGYQVAEVVYQGRLGAEYVLSRMGAKTCLQIKWQRKPVPERAIESLRESRASRGCAFALMVSARGFSRGARVTSRSAGIWLWAYHNLEAELERLTEGIPEGMKIAAAAKSD